MAKTQKIYRLRARQTAVDTSPQPLPASLTRAWQQARRRRAMWEPLWRSCYAYALPRYEADPGAQPSAPYDGTAIFATTQLAASLLGEIAPPGARWCGLEPSAGLDENSRATLAPILEASERLLQEQFAASNLSVELHQSLLDMVVAGTGCLLAEASAPGAASALRFQSVPLAELALSAGDDGDIGVIFRRRAYRAEDFTDRFPEHSRVAQNTTESADGAGDIVVVDALRPIDDGRWRCDSFLDEASRESDGAALLRTSHMSARPILVFRWTRTAGELWGRSPVMQALPEIRAANRIVDLSLRNAALSAVGVWQVDDDGVLDPTQIRLEPGTIIPRAVGSRGLSPLDTGRGFDLNQLILSEMRSHIRAALLSDRLAPTRGGKRTATEVLAEASDNARVLGAHYGRLASELVQPLALRSLHLLSLQGLLPPPFSAAGLSRGKLPRGVSFRHRAPLAQLQSQRDSANFFVFLERLFSLGGAALETLDVDGAVRHSARLLGVPESLLRSDTAAASIGGCDSGIERRESVL